MTRVAVAAVAVFVAFAAFLVLAPGRVSEDTIGAVDDVVFVVLTLIGALSTALTARATRGRRRAAWIVMTVAMLAWGLGDVLWTYYEQTGRAPSPSAADVAYLIYPVAATGALLLFPTTRSAEFPIRTVLDGLIVAGSLFIVSWRTGLAVVYHDSVVGRTETLLALAYALTAVVVLTVSAVVVVRTPAGHRLPMVLLTVGLAFSALASGFFAYIDPVAQYSSGHLIDLGWVLSALLVTVAAYADRRPGGQSGGDEDTSTWATAWMPYVPLLGAAIAIATTTGSDQVVTGPVPALSAAILGTVLLRQYLTDRENRRLMRRVTDQALHDPLTGLANRAYFQRRMNQLTERGVAVSVLALDLDDFKAVNDTYGHAVGDELLVAVAGRLQQCVRIQDTVARLGGDEFVILIEGTSDYANEVAARLAERFAEPFQIGGVRLDVRFGLGIAAAESEAAGEELLRRADIAMYDTKRAARPRSSGRPGPAAVISS